MPHTAQNLILRDSIYAVEVMTSHKLAHAYFLSVAMVLVHAHCAYTHILYSHNTGTASQCKSLWTNSRVVRAMCVLEVTSDCHGVLENVTDFWFPKKAWLALLQESENKQPVKHFEQFMYLILETARYRVAQKNRNSRYSRFFRTLLWSTVIFFYLAG